MLIVSATLARVSAKPLASAVPWPARSLLCSNRKATASVGFTLQPVLSPSLTAATNVRSVILDHCVGSYLRCSVERFDSSGKCYYEIERLTAHAKCLTVARLFSQGVDVSLARAPILPPAQHWLEFTTFSATPPITVLPFTPPNLALGKLFPVPPNNSEELSCRLLAVSPLFARPKAEEWVRAFWTQARLALDCYIHGLSLSLQTLAGLSVVGT